MVSQGNELKYYKMKKFTIEQFQNDFDNLIDRVENGESFMITDGEKDVVITTAKEYKCMVTGNNFVDDELIRIHTDHEEGC
jgi:prevent-host-death family protein